MVIKDGTGLKTDLFVKETDTHQYLDFSSCHTFNTKKRTPYGQALRIKRIVSEEEVLDDRCKKLECWLKQACGARSLGKFPKYRNKKKSEKKMFTPKENIRE